MNTTNFKEETKIICAVLPDFEFSYDDLENCEIEKDYKIIVGMTHRYEKDAYVCLEIECHTKTIDVEIDVNKNCPDMDYYNASAECPELNKGQILAKVVDSHKVDIIHGSIVEITRDQLIDLMHHVEEMVEIQIKKREGVIA